MWRSTFHSRGNSEVVLSAELEVGEGSMACMDAFSFEESCHLD